MDPNIFHAAAAQSQGSEFAGYDMNGVPTEAELQTAPRATDSPQAIAGNVLQDGLEMGQGLAALGSVGMTRLYEQLPHWNNNQFQMKPIIRPFALSPEEPSDFQTAGNVFHAVVDQYKQNYYDPIATGHPEQIAQYALEHPLYFGLDVAPVLKWSGAAKIAGKVAASARNSEMVVNAVSKAKNIFHAAVEQAEAHPALQERVQNIKRGMYQRNLENDFNSRMGDDYAQRKIIYGKLLESKKALPEAEQAELMAIAEGTHPNVLQQGYAGVSPGQQEYLAHLRELAQNTASRAKQLGHLTDEDMFKATYAPLVKPLVRRMFGIDVDFDALPVIEKNKLLYLAKTELDRLGVKPIYQARMFEREAGKVLQSPFEFKPGLLRVAAQRAKRATELPTMPELASREKALKLARIEAQNALTAEERNAWEQQAASHETFIRDAKRAQNIANGNKDHMADVKKLGFEFERKAERGEQFSADSAKVAIARDIQVNQAYHLYSALLDRITKEATDVANLTPKEQAMLQAGLLSEWTPRELFRNMTRQIRDMAEADQIALASALPERVVLPTPLVESLTKFAKMQDKPGYLKHIANFARRYVLGFNLTFAEAQGGQNLIMLGLTQFKGPRNAILSIASYALAMDKNVVKKLPPGMLEEMFEGERITGQGIFGKHVEGFIDKNFERTAHYDRYARAVAGIQYALEMSETTPEFGPLLTGWLDSGEAMNRIAHVMGDAKLAEPVAKKVLTVLGDYTRQTAQKRAAIRSNLLWWMWYEHALKFAYFLPGHNPVKTSLLSGLIRVTPELFQDPNASPETNKMGAVRVKGAENSQGIPYYIMGGALNPLGTIPEILEQITQPFDTGSTENSAIGAMNPIWSLAIAALAHRNPQTGNDFKDPNMVQAGEQFKPEDVAQGEYKPQHPVPNLFELAGRYFINRPVRVAERITAALAGGEPSQFTTPWNPAPRKQFNAEGAPIAPPSWPNLALQLLVNIRTTPIDESTRPIIERLHQQNMIKARRNAARQGIRLEGYINAGEEETP